MNSIINFGKYIYSAIQSFLSDRRTSYINDYSFPGLVREKVKERYRHLSEDDIDEVILGLREYFHICNRAGYRMVAMPSQVVDVAWHEFILFTRQYGEFCNKALGHFLHHTPAEAMQSPDSAQSGIRRAWKLSCNRLNIVPSAPAVLPILFAIDANLNIEDGFYYTKNCSDSLGKEENNSAVIYCATHIGCTTGCSGDSGANSDSGFGGDSGCSSGCGGCGGD
jgi:hypothetical protein